MGQEKRVCSLSLWEERLRVLRPRETLVVGERRHCQCGWGLSQERRGDKISWEQDVSYSCRQPWDRSDRGIWQVNGGQLSAERQSNTYDVRSRWRHWGWRGGCQWLQWRHPRICQLIQIKGCIWDGTYVRVLVDMYVPTCITLFKAGGSLRQNRQQVTAKKSSHTFWWLFGKDKSVDICCTYYKEQVLSYLMLNPILMEITNEKEQNLKRSQLYLSLLYFSWQLALAFSFQYPWWP